MSSSSENQPKSKVAYVPARLSTQPKSDSSISKSKSKSQAQAHKVDPDDIEMPEYEEKENDDMLANLKGDYTSEHGIFEFLNMVDRAINLISSETIQDYYTDTKLMHEIMPASITATGAELEKYKTKFHDVVYYLHRLQNPSREFRDAQHKNKRQRNE